MNIAFTLTSTQELWVALLACDRDIAYGPPSILTQLQELREAISVELQRRLDVAPFRDAEDNLAEYAVRTHASHQDLVDLARDRWFEFVFVTLGKAVPIS